VIGRAFRILNKELQLHRFGATPKRTTRAGQLYYVFPNGHKLWVAGCKNRVDAEKFRGDPYCLAAVDECDSMRGHLKYLINEVLGPSMLDFNGQIALTGTPGVTPEGFFYDISTGAIKGWGLHHWTVRENSHMPHAEEWLREQREELGLDENSAAYLREWLGQWVLDLESLCYQFDLDLNTFEVDPVLAAGYRIVIGVDLGVNDATAFAVCAYRPGDPDIWTLEASSWNNLSPSAAYARLRTYLQKYPQARVVADTGGQGLAFVKEWQDSFNFYAEPAKKLDVAGQIAFMNGLLKSGVLKVHTYNCRTLRRQIMATPWDEKRKGHAPDYDDHELDAWRYAVLAIRTGYTAELEPPKEGSPEAVQAVLAERKRRVFERMRKKQGSLIYTPEDPTIYLPMAA
jgi:hypothetical protein